MTRLTDRRDKKQDTTVQPRPESPASLHILFYFDSRYVRAARCGVSLRQRRRAAVDDVTLLWALATCGRGPQDSVLQGSAGCYSSGTCPHRSRVAVLW